MSIPNSSPAPQQMTRIRYLSRVLRQGQCDLLSRGRLRCRCGLEVVGSNRICPVAQLTIRPARVINQRRSLRWVP